MTTRTRPRSWMTVDFEHLGYETVKETRDVTQAKTICALHVRALMDDVQPRMDACAAQVRESGARIASLCAQLYEGVDPVRDTEMIGRRRLAIVLAMLLGIVLLASVVTHAVTFVWLGQSWIVSLGMALVLTGTATAAGHVAIDGLLTRQAPKAIIGTAVWVAILVGLWQIGEARGLMAETVMRATTADADASFVDSEADSATGGTEATTPSSESRVGTLLGNATAKIMIAADTMAGVLLALLIGIVAHPRFSSWRHLQQLKAETMAAAHEQRRLQALPERAWKDAAAGILRGAHFAQGQPVTPYFTVMPVALLACLLAMPAFSQPVIAKHTVIVIDTSGSIGANAGSGHLFREYLQGARALLTNLPPNTRVWVDAISTDSFGGVEPLLRGRTPGVRGVFVDDIVRARQQLVRAFEVKASQLSASAQGTDVFGAIAHAKAAADSADTGTLPRPSSELVLLSDMVHEVPGFLMPALVSTGPDQMLAKARKDGVVIPLAGWKVRVLGASTSGRTPQTWNTIRAFWHKYFAASGAELVQYSSDVILD